MGLTDSYLKSAEILELVEAAKDQLSLIDLSLSPNWNGSILTNVSLYLDAVAKKLSVADSQS